MSARFIQDSHSYSKGNQKHYQNNNNYQSSDYEQEDRQDFDQFYQQDNDQQDYDSLKFELFKPSPKLNAEIDPRGNPVLFFSIVGSALFLFACLTSVFYYMKKQKRLKALLVNTNTK
ncbi:hypothetical protein HDV01_002720 [Terramyces sp. JEL0728]|nr:hypothetical protein HDV01_002720 [Terramyces sp. JEL0728]